MVEAMLSVSPVVRPLEGKSVLASLCRVNSTLMLPSWFTLYRKRKQEREEIESVGYMYVHTTEEEVSQ